MMMKDPDLTLDVHLFPTSDGGRKSSTPSNRFHCMFKVKNEFHDCQLLLDDIGSLSPGQQATVPVILLRPDTLRNKLTKGQPLALFEGSKQIGKAKVLNVLI